VYLTPDQLLDAASLPSCTCKRGKSRCHHMAVAMLHAYRSVSCTDKVCRWSQPVESDSNIQTVSEMFAQSKPAPCLNRPMTDDDRAFFLHNLQQSGVQCGMTWLLSPEPSASIPAAPTICDLLLDRGLSADANDGDVAAFIAELSVSADCIASIELQTHGQQTNLLWHQFRCGRLTASNFGSIIKTMKSRLLP